MKELLEREVINRVSSPEEKKSFRQVDLLVSSIAKVTGRLGHYMEIPCIQEILRKLSSSITKEELDKVSKLYEDIISEFGLEPWEERLLLTEGEDYYDPSCYGKGKNTKIFSMAFCAVGEDMLCYTEYFSKDDRIIPIFNGIIYTSKTMDVAKEIWCRYSEACREIINGHDEEISKTYTITTVTVNKSSGEYQSFVTDVYPTVSLMSPDFMDNYNKDFPSTKVENFFEMDKGGIMIFNGSPGCGKSTYLKSLIFKNPDIHFVILPQYLLLAQEVFKNFLIRTSSNERESVFIVEDCEQLLVQRESNSIQFSSVISDILNYTDGIFGDLTRTKFIFTFNTDLNNIDKALLRPGRLHLKYEFTPLIGENLEKIASKLDYALSPEEKKNGVSLAELYSKTKTDELVINKREKRKIGYLGVGRTYEDCEEDTSGRYSLRQ